MRVRTSGSQITLELTGELDISTCPPITDALTAGLADPTVQSVVFDLRDVTFMDSSGVKCLVLALRHVRPRKGSVTVCNVQPKVARLIRILGIDREVHLAEADPATSAASDATSRTDEARGARFEPERRLING